MDTAKQGGRALKQRILELLKSADFEKELEPLSRIPARQVINPLFSFLSKIDEQIRWRAVIVMGGVVAQHADEDMESARIIMGRFVWKLNDESGRPVKGSKT